jgi:hypothetical protein
MFASDNIRLVAWDIAENKTIMDEELRPKFSVITHNGEECKRIGGLGWPTLTATPNQIMFAGNYYEYGAKRSKIGTVIFSYNTQNKSTQQFVLPGPDELFTFSAHPSNPNLVAAIFMANETFDNYAALVDLNNLQVKHKLLIGKGGLIPLCAFYSADGKLVYTGFGNSSYGGGFEVHDAESGKLVKRVMLPTDQGKAFFEWRDFLVVAGHTNSYIIDKTKWVIVHTFKNLEITDVNLEKNLAIGNYIKQGDRTKFDEMMVVNLESKTITTHQVTKSHDYKFLPNSNQIYAPFFKHSYKEEEKTLDNPSVIVFSLPSKP